MRTSNIILLVFTALIILGIFATVISAKSTTALPADVELTGQRGQLDYEALPIKHLDIHGKIKVILTAGLPQHRIEADQGLLELLADQDDDPETLRIELPENVQSEEVVAYISTPELESVTLNGNGRLESAAPLAFRQNTIELNGSPSADLNYTNAERIKIGGSGGTNTRLAGKTRYLEASFSGGNGLEAVDMQASFVEVRGSGSTDATVHADSSLSVRLSGSGNVRYAGNPKLTTRTSGSGSVESIESGVE